MMKKEKIKCATPEITVTDLAEDIITTSGETSNGFDGEVDNW